MGIKRYSLPLLPLPAPDTVRAVTFCVPDSEEYLQAFFQQVQPLIYWFSWERDPIQKRGKEIARVWHSVYLEAYNDAFLGVPSSCKDCEGEETDADTRADTWTELTDGIKGDLGDAAKDAFGAVLTSGSFLSIPTALSTFAATFLFSAASRIVARVGDEIIGVVEGVAGDALEVIFETGITGQKTVTYTEEPMEG